MWLKMRLEDVVCLMSLRCCAVTNCCAYVPVCCNCNRCGSSWTKLRLCLHQRSINGHMCVVAVAQLINLRELWLEVRVWVVVDLAVRLVISSSSSWRHGGIELVDKFLRFGMRRSFYVGVCSEVAVRRWYRTSEISFFEVPTVLIRCRWWFHHTTWSTCKNHTTIKIGFMG